MYEEGFKWWSLGRASAVAFLLFMLMFAGDRACSCASARERSERMNDERRARAAASNTPAGRRRAARRVPLLWMSRCRSCPRRGEHVSAAVAAGHPTLDNYRELFCEAGMGRYMFNSALIATLATLISLVLNTLAGYAFAKLRFRGRERMFRAARRAGDPGQVAMIPLFVLVKQMGLVSTYGGVDRAGHGERVRHLPRPAVRALVAG